MLHLSVFSPIQSSVNPLNPVSAPFPGGLACFSLSILVLLFFNLELNPQSLFGLRLEVTRSQGARLELLLQYLPLVSSKLANGTKKGCIQNEPQEPPRILQFPIYKAIFRNENKRKKKFQQTLLYLGPGFPSPRRQGQRSKGIFTISHLSVVTALYMRARESKATWWVCLHPCAHHVSLTPTERQGGHWVRGAWRFPYLQKDVFQSRDIDWK